jgi:hypothetical protein
MVDRLGCFMSQGGSFLGVFWIKIEFIGIESDVAPRERKITSYFQKIKKILSLKFFITQILNARIENTLKSATSRNYTYHYFSLEYWLPFSCCFRALVCLDGSLHASIELIQLNCGQTIISAK